MNSSTSEYKHIEYITLLSVISAISVVCLHTNGCFWEFSYARYWFTANIIESVFYFAVPVFFMISGATLVNYNTRYSTKRYFAKRIRKTVLPFIAWSLVGLIYNILLKRISITEVNVKYIINGILSANIISTYWFFPVLFNIYLCIPIFAVMLKDNRKKVFIYLSVGGFLINVLMPFIINVLKLNITWPYSISVGNGYLIYIFVGYLLNEYDISRRNEFLIYLGAICGLLIHIIGTYRLSVKAGDIVQTFKGYDNVPCIMYSVGIFLFFKKYGNKILKIHLLRTIVFFLGKYTFGIYLVHGYIMKIVQVGFAKLLNFSYLSIVYRLGSPVIIVAIAVGVVYILREIPITKWMVP